jgi:hypothetical protein
MRSSGSASSNALPPVKAMPKTQTLEVPPDCLVVFLDETGHERMPKGHTYYGIGGCAVLRRDYEQTIAQPWRGFRQLVTGNPDTPLHAFEFGRDATTDQLEAFGTVFRNNPFMRIGAAGAITTEMPKDASYKEHLTAINDEEHLAWVVLRALHQRIVDVACWTPFQSLALIFEQNPRSKRLVQSAFSDLGFEEDGKKLPVGFYDMPKSAAEPALEVADFIANTIAGHARAHLVERRSGFRKDFQAVFQSVGPKLASFFAITSVGYGPGEQISPSPS